MITQHSDSSQSASSQNPYDSLPWQIQAARAASQASQSSVAWALPRITSSQSQHACMHAANNNGIKILGAIILRFSGKSTSGQTLETRQIVYVTHDSDKIFLNRETCKALGMITGSFPTVGETPQSSTENESNMSSDAAGQTHQPSPPNVPDNAHNPPAMRLPTTCDTST